MDDLPLAGVRILDMTVAWSGPYATMFLADFGAEVIRVENPWIFPSSTRGLFARPPAAVVAADGPVMSGYPDRDPGDRPWNRAAMFNWHGRNKRSVTLDVRKESGKEQFLRLVEVSDVLVENNAPRLLEGLGLGPDVLAARNPRLIVLRMPSGGLTGPYRDHVGFGTSFEGLVGLRSIRGFPGTAPEDAPGSLHMDTASGAAGAFAVMLALRRRGATGAGTLIDLGQLENLVQQIGEVVTASAHGAPSGPVGNRDGRHAPQGVYPCAGDDRWVTISVGSDDEWVALRRVIGDPDWASDDRFATLAGRRAAADELDALVSAWTAELDRHDVFHRCQDAGVAAAPVIDEADAYADPQLRHRDFFRPLTSPHTGEHEYPAHVVRWTGPALRWQRAAPGLGEDNEYVYQELLGLTDEEYAELRDEGHISLDYLDQQGRPL